MIDHILYQCKLNPLTLAVCIPGVKSGSITYGALGNFIHSVANTALNMGLHPGDIAATYISDPVLNFTITLGLMRARVVGMALRGPAPIPGINPSVVLTDRPGHIGGDLTVATVDYSWLHGDTTATITPQPKPNGPSWIVLTSGSTGQPKGVAFSHQLMMARTAAYSSLRGPRFAHCSRFFCDVSIATSPGLHYTLALLSRGGTIYFLGPDPADILQTIGLHDIRGMGSTPFGLAEFLKYFEADSTFEMPFNHIICQGALVSEELSRRARARICQNLYISYGATETSTAAFGPASIVEKTPMAVGYPLPGMTIEAIDKDGKVLPPLKDGSIRIRSPYMAAGYEGDPETTKELFRDGYFYSGDLGHLTPEGLLVITGREKAVLNIGGASVSPERVEEIISSFSGIEEAGVFARTNDLGVAEIQALLVAKTPIDGQMLREHCARQLPLSCIPVQFTIVDALPRVGQGKLDRSRFPALAKS